MPRYICIPCQTPRAEKDLERYLHCAALVDAESHEEAAAIANEIIERESDEDIDPDYLAEIFTYEVDPEAFVAMKRRPAYERAPDEWQCCGGPCAFTEDGHYATCPHHEE